MFSSRKLSATVILIALTLSTPLAYSQHGSTDSPTTAPTQGPAGIQYIVQGNQLTTVDADQHRETIRLPCNGDKSAASRTRLYISCGERGVLLVSISNPNAPEPLELKPVKGTVTDLFVVKDRVWIELADGSAQPADEVLGLSAEVAAPQKPVAPPEPATRAEAPTPQAEAATAANQGAPEPAPKAPTTKVLVGEVIDSGPGFVIISIGRKDGIERGMNIELTEKAPLKLASGMESFEERFLDIGTVTGLEDSTAQVSLSRNVQVPKSDIIAHLTSKSIKQGPGFAPRVKDTTIIKLGVRPFLPLSDRGIGFVMDAGFGYRFSFPLSVDVELSPFTSAFLSDTNTLTFAGAGIVSYDSDYFQLGIGTGFSRVRVPALFSSKLRNDGDDVAWSVIQQMRIGSYDGRNVGIQTRFVMLDTWTFDGITLNGQTDMDFLGENWLVGRVDLGLTGQSSFEVGLRMLLRGNGGDGSIFLTPLIGAVLLSYADCPESTNTPNTSVTCAKKTTGGPMIGASMEWRN